MPWPLCAQDVVAYDGCRLPERYVHAGATLLELLWVLPSFQGVYPATAGAWRASNCSFTLQVGSLWQPRYCNEYPLRYMNRWDQTISQWAGWSVCVLEGSGLGWVLDWAHCLQIDVVCNHNAQCKRSNYVHQCMDQGTMLLRFTQWNITTPDQLYSLVFPNILKMFLFLVGPKAWTRHCHSPGPPVLI